MKLWFDVEERYNATSISLDIVRQELWFDVEERYNATKKCVLLQQQELWFDVEERYNATATFRRGAHSGCGLM